MLATEIPQEFRQQILWERRQNNPRPRRHDSSGSPICKTMEWHQDHTTQDPNHR
ncbi:hypothetical protein F5B17DRAFT_423320, partial [Nemania serpens]